MNPCVLFSGIPQQPYIPYACGMDSAGLRNTFRTHTECIPHPIRNMRSVYYRIPERVDTMSPLIPERVDKLGMMYEGAISNFWSNVLRLCTKAISFVAFVK